MSAFGYGIGSPHAAAPADAAYRDTRHSPTPHYADFPEPENRTTAIPDVPQDHVGNMGGF